MNETNPSIVNIASTPTIDEISIADDPERWHALGFTTVDGIVELGAVRIALVGRRAGRGILGWSVRGIASGELDGLPTTSSDLPSPTTASRHPNGVTAIDHVVAMSPMLDRSVRALRSAGLDLRRIREQPTPAGAPRQAFFRLGAVILEVVQEPGELAEKRGDGGGPARFWGLALLACDLSRTVAHMSGHVSEIRPAVQPGRRIATLRRSAGLAIPIALMSRTTGSEGT